MYKDELDALHKHLNDDQDMEEKKNQQRKTKIKNIHDDDTAADFPVTYIYISECWRMREQDEKRILTAEMS